jgi:predicted transcriptional regulator
MLGISALKLLDVIEKVSSKNAPGPAPSFNEAHVIKALELINDHAVIGRMKLSKELVLGEGATRTLLKHLKKEGITQISRKGVSLSDNGKKLFSDLRNNLSESIEIPPSPLTIGLVNVAVLIRDSAQAVKSGMEQRDTAIKSGATGATTLIFSGNKLSLPTGEKNFSKSLPLLHEELMAKLNPIENCVIIVGSGETKELAEIGAKMAAIKLLKSNN